MAYVGGVCFMIVSPSREFADFGLRRFKIRTTPP